VIGVGQRDVEGDRYKDRQDKEPVELFKHSASVIAWYLSVVMSRLYR
jgi:hypothetical protein